MLGIVSLLLNASFLGHAAIGKKLVLKLDLGSSGLVGILCSQVVTYIYLGSHNCHISLAEHVVAKWRVDLQKGRCSSGMYVCMYIIDIVGTT